MGKSDKEIVSELTKISIPYAKFRHDWVAYFRSEEFFNCAFPKTKDIGKIQKVYEASDFDRDLEKEKNDENNVG